MAQLCKKSSSGWRAPLKKRGSRLKVLLKITTENGIYSHPMKVISHTILFVYSLRGVLIKLRAGVTRDGAIISMEPPH